MAIIRGFRDLRVYQQARLETQRVFKFTQTFPREGKFSLTDQIRRSSRAVNSMIAEAWAHRRYPAAFVSKLTDSLGEATETQVLAGCGVGLRLPQRRSASRARCRVAIHRRDDQQDD